MMSGGWYKGLGAQLIALLTLAFLPLGLIALFQTNRVAVETDRTASLALMGLTEQAARKEQLLIERAVGASRLFGSIAPDLLRDPKSCANNLRRVVNANPEYSFIGVVPLTGFAVCSSSNEIVDFRNAPGFKKALAAQEPAITAIEAGPASAHSVFVVFEPFDIDGEFAGFVSVSIPHSGLPDTSERLEDLGLEELITFNEAGKILTTRSNVDEAQHEMPAGTTLAGLSTEEPRTFRSKNVDGVERRYSIVTIAGSPAAVMAVWRIKEGAISKIPVNVAPVLFPLLMWIASMGVAMLAVHTLVGRHLRRLQRKMNSFADSRQVDEPAADSAILPTEIALLEENFNQMSHEIMRDEAVLEDALREKDVLVKEIHHRVKNNLQLISSIINMQIRGAEHHETKTVLRRVQERVLSLATIHRDLYQSQDGGRVNVGALITEIVEKSTELAAPDGSKVNVTMNVQPICLFPDQAVPLSMLVAEATTNAMKYIGGLGTTKGKIDVSLTQDDLACLFTMTNTVGPAERQESTGLGSKLMQAFAMQMGGKLETEETVDTYTLTLEFNALEFQPEQRDF